MQKIGTAEKLELLSLLPALLFMAGCGQSGSSSSSGPAARPSVKISCYPGAILVGQTSQCTATVTGTGSDNSAVNWKVNGVEGGNATVGTISRSGLYTAPSSIAKQTNFTVSTEVGTLFNGSFAGTAITVSP